MKIKPHITAVLWVFILVLLSLSGSGLTQTVLADTVPQITSPGELAVVADSPFTYQITATNHPTHFVALRLPTGLHLNPATGLISGKVVRTGNYRIFLAASHYGQTYGNSELWLQVQASSKSKLSKTSLVPNGQATGQPQQADGTDKRSSGVKTQEPKPDVKPDANGNVALEEVCQYPQILKTQGLIQKIHSGVYSKVNCR